MCVCVCVCVDEHDKTIPSSSSAHFVSWCLEGQQSRSTLELLTFPGQTARQSSVCIELSW